MLTLMLVLSEHLYELKLLQCAHGSSVITVNLKVRFQHFLLSISGLTKFSLVYFILAALRQFLSELSLDYNYIRKKFMPTADSCYGCT